MTTTSIPFGLFNPHCELCGELAPPNHSHPRRGGFIQAQSPRNRTVESLRLWVCEGCAPHSGTLFPFTLTRQQVKTLDRVRRDQGTIAGREVIRPSCFESPSELTSSSLGVDELAAWHLVNSVKGIGPRAASVVHDAGITPSQLIENPDRFPQTGKRAQAIVAALKNLTARDHGLAWKFADAQLQRAKVLDATVISYDQSDYPSLVRNSNNPIPILWVRGNASILRSPKTVACVGSRGITIAYKDLEESFVDIAVKERFVITSGFAMGADSVGHRRALEIGGETICVMPCGVDLVFPPENRKLWHDLMDSGRAVFISEFAFGRRAASLTLRKRNKLIVSTAQGILIAQSSKSGGAMNAFRFGLEQKKPIATFDADETDRTSGNRKISGSAKGNIVSFPTMPMQEDYRRWLRALCSSI